MTEQTPAPSRVTLDDLLDQLELATYRLEALERINGALAGMAQRNPTPSNKRASYKAMLRKRAVNNEVQEILDMVSKTEVPSETHP